MFSNYSINKLVKELDSLCVVVENQFYKGKDKAYKSKVFKDTKERNRYNNLQEKKKRKESLERFMDNYVGS